MTHSKAILRKKNKVGGIMCPYFKLYYKAIVIKRVWYWHKNRHLINETEERAQNKSMHIYYQLIYDKGAKNV